MATKPQVVVLNKIDLPHVQERQNDILDGIRNSITHSRVLTISAAGRVGLDTLVEKTHRFLLKIKKDEQEVGDEEDVGEGGGVVEEDVGEVEDEKEAHLGV